MRRTLLLPILLLPAFRPADPDLGRDYAEKVRPVLAKYCLDCHSTQKKKGDLDLERFSSLDAIRKDLKPWPLVIENLENGEMPPKKSAQPGAEDRKTITAWTRAMLDAEARARAGDPGRVVVRRLSNAEYNNTIRDLTGVDLQPARDFPADGAAGEGFANTGDALVMSPTLLNKYLNAAKEISAHALLLPDGLRFSPAKTPRDWTDEVLAGLRAFFAPYSKDGKLPFKPYLSATVRRRDELAAGKLEEVAASEKLNAKYLGILWTTLNGAEPSFPLDRIRARWRNATVAQVDGIAAEISVWQDALWKFNKFGSYAGNKTSQQEGATPEFVEAQTLKLQPKPVAGQGDVIVYLSTLEASGSGDVVWRRPRFAVGKQPPLLLKDYARYGAAYEIDLKAVFSDAAAYLTAVAENKTPDGLDPTLLKRWRDVLALTPAGATEIDPAKMVPAVALEPLDVIERSAKFPAIKGWRSRAGELPVLLSNASDMNQYIPGLASAHKIVVHPSPDRFVAAAWTSPFAGKVRVDAKIRHVHAGCGNGTLWWVEARRGDRSAFLAEGVVNISQSAQVPTKELQIAAGDMILVAVDPRDGQHTCDLTQIDLTLTEIDGEHRTWDLAKDRADSILDPNPNWRFVMGSTKRVASSTAATIKIPNDSVLGKWRAAPSEELAQKVQALLVGGKPADDKSPDAQLYRALAVVDSPFFLGLDFSKIGKAAPKGPYGLEAARFNEAGDVVAPAGTTIELRLPSALFREHELVVDGNVEGERAVQFHLSSDPPQKIRALLGKQPCVARGEAAKQLARGLDEFRRCFPPFILFSNIVPTDEGVCLKMYHRDDEPLTRLFLDDAQAKRLDRLWEELRYISQWPVTERTNLPQFIGYVTQDGGAEAVKFFEGLREPFRKRAEAFEKELVDSEPRHVDALVGFAAKAYRRPLTEAELRGVRALYGDLRKKEMSHAEAVRATLARILVSPSFLFRLEETSPGAEARPVSDAELATRLSYFLWASTPDEELLRVAAEGKLREPAILSAQVDRMLKDPKIRGLATEFATQWLHVRTLRQNREKNEKLFPTFDDALREALFEETVLLFKDLFQNGRPASHLIDADYTWLNERLAQHYGIPGVQGSAWRRVEGVKKHGRGGVLALGSVLTTESGASRTSPVLRGNWLIDTLLGERLPKPPANVPRLPEDENAAEGTVREMVAKHTRVPECATCHVRIDPFGFALEKYDPIGRFRSKDLAGRPVDVSVELKDGTRFEGLDGLRAWLLEKRRKDVERTFCQKLLGYALGRSVMLSDQPLIDEMVSGLEREGPLSGALRAVVGSRQFLFHRALDATKEE
ncbi:MAG TPA: DUF1592 domain-containing protein [Planctomycetota bacterium]|nr:DUF1592 domain-containing protein [Planctomycetota bacterium]